MSTIIQSPRRFGKTTRFNWQARYTGLNNKIAFYELRLLDLLSERAPGMTVTARQKRAYTLALKAWKTYCNQLQTHMENPV